MNLTAQHLQKAWRDLAGAVRHWQVWFFIGLQEIKLRYRRSILGPFWITLSMAAMIIGVGFVYSGIFKQDINTYLPFFASGYIVWFYVNALVQEGCIVFIQDGTYIRQVPGPLLSYIFKSTWRCVIVLGHNAIFLFMLLLYFGILPNVSGVLLALIGFALVTINGTWMALLLAVLSSRYRDIPQIVQSAMAVIFLVTPVLWDPANVDRSLLLVTFNPFHYLVDVVRGPLLDKPFEPLSWLVVLLMAAVGTTATFLFFARYRSRIPYWV